MLRTSVIRFVLANANSQVEDIWFKAVATEAFTIAAIDAFVDSLAAS